MRSLCKSELTWLVVSSTTGQPEWVLHKESSRLCFDEDVEIASCCRTCIDDFFWQKKPLIHCPCLSLFFIGHFWSSLHRPSMFVPCLQTTSSQVQGSKTHNPAYRMCLFCSHGGTQPDEVCGFVFEKLRNRNQLEACLIAPGLEDYFQSSLKVEIFSAVLMTNVSL